MAEDSELVYSPLCREIHQGDQSVEVIIYQDADGKWILEIEDEEGSSTLWKDTFARDEYALNEAISTIERIGISGIINGDDD